MTLLKLEDRVANLNLVPVLPPGDAACKGTNPDDWFPHRRSQPRTVARLKTICAGCELRDPCFTYAVTNPSVYGVWGGTTEEERMRLRAARYKEGA